MDTQYTLSFLNKQKKQKTNNIKQFQRCVCLKQTSSKVAALLSTTPRLQPRSSTNDLVPPLDSHYDTTEGHDDRA